MLQWLNPAGLWALSAVLVPVAIHLWHKKQGRVVQVGSLRWLKAQQSRKLHSIRLNEPWLLMLRCLIIALAALAFAEPQWEHRGHMAPQEVVFISPEVLASQQAINAIRPTIDSLQQAGYGVKRFEEGFSEIDGLASVSNADIQQIAASIPHETLAQFIAEQTPPGSSVWLFTSDRRKSWKQQTAVIPASWNWIPVRLSADTTWVQQAWLSGPDTLQVQFGYTDADSINYTLQAFAVPGAQGRIGTEKAETFQYQKGTDSLYIYSGSTKVLSLANRPLRLQIVHDAERGLEVKYLQPALEAVLAYKNIWHSLTVSDTLDTSASAAYLFWWSAQPLPQVAGNKHVTVIQRVAADNDASETNAWISTKGSRMEMHRFAGEAQGQPVWKDSYGRIILGRQKDGNATVFQLAMGLDTDWSDLAYREELPEMLADILLAQFKREPLYDYRAYEEKQLSRFRLTAGAEADFDDRKPQVIDLRVWFILAAMLLWAAERWYISLRKG
jgi:hypothetical protein